MRKIFVFFLFLALAQGALALGVAVSPDSIVFDGDEERFRIINPNNESIIFSVKGAEVDCEPEKGELAMLESVTVACKAADSAAGDSTILVETEPKDKKSSVGMIPAVAVRVKMPGSNENTEDKAENIEKGLIKEGASPETIEKSVLEPESSGKDEAGGVGEEAKTGERSKEEEEKGILAAIMADMKMEMITIALLTAAILGILAYSHVKERKEDKEKEKHGEKICAGQTMLTSFHAAWHKDPRQASGQSTRQGCGHP